jgi:hypothetical protein
MPHQADSMVIWDEELSATITSAYTALLSGENLV